jgi:hypothetical protein
VREQPLLADFIETSPDVAFQHPGGAGFAGEHREALLQGIGAPAAFAKAIGVLVGQSLGDGCERKRVEGCMARSCRVGMLKGRSLPLGLGM